MRSGIEQSNEIIPVACFRWPLRALVLAGVCLTGAAIYVHPRVGDDWNLAWTFAAVGSLDRFIASMYQSSGGRLFTYALDGMIVSSDTAARLFKLLTVPCFLLFAACVSWLSGTKVGDDNPPRWLVTAGILWLGLPVVSDTVVQVTGACAYLWPATAGLLFLCLFRGLYLRALSGGVERVHPVARAGWLAAGIIVGTCNEQLFAGMAVVLIGWAWILRREGRLRHVPAEAWWGLAGLLAGTVVLVAAPGNYVRLGAEAWGEGGVLSMLMRYVTYVGGAYFALGTGDAGRTLWLGIAAIALTGTLTTSGNARRETCIWLAASLATLAPMLPLVNVASPRTTFLAATFLVIAVLSAFPLSAPSTRQRAAWCVLTYGIAMLVVIDGLVGLASNRSLAQELAAREEAMKSAAMKGQSEVVVPHLATIPSRITFMLNPGHDAVFVTKLARHHGLVHGHLDGSPSAPKPYSLNALKALKNGL